VCQAANGRSLGISRTRHAKFNGVDHLCAHSVCYLALILTLGLTPDTGRLGTPAATRPGSASKLDHILLWGSDIDRATATMAVKLGFQVRPGRNPGGVANRFIRMADRGYIELLGITRPNPDMDPGMRADQASLQGGPGSRSFGLHSSVLDQVYAFLRGQGFGLTPIFTASPTDPDGGGPSQPPRWSLFAFDRSPLSSTVFFIDYASDKTAAANDMDDQVAREHPNGARELSAVWLLSSDANADKEQLQRMGFAGALPIRIPQISARGYCVPVGPNGIFALEPAGSGIAADALRSGGPQVLGISIGVADLDRAKRLVERGYEQPLTRFKGILGDSFLAPTRGDLGMLIEFHALPRAAVPRACGDLKA
jgi:hypothetical protein